MGAGREELGCKAETKRTSAWRDLPLRSQRSLQGGPEWTGDSQAPREEQGVSHTQGAAGLTSHPLALTHWPDMQSQRSERQAKTALWCEAGKAKEKCLLIFFTEGMLPNAQAGKAACISVPLPWTTLYTLPRFTCAMFIP